MDFILNLLITSAGRVWLTFLHNWPFLAISIILAAVLKLYLDPQRVSAFMLRHQKAGVAGATILAVTTPLCSCGTTAVVLGMIANLMPWAPIVAFMVSSPLTSPEELVYSAGLFGWPFALAFFAASIFLGLLGGTLAGLFDRRGWLANQTRLSLASTESRSKTRPVTPQVKPASLAATPPARLTLQPAVATCCAGDRPQLLTLDAIGCGCDQGSSTPPMAAGCACGSAQATGPFPAPACACENDEPGGRTAVTARVLLNEMVATGKHLLVMFFGFAFIGYVLNGLIPATWVAAIFDSGNVYSIPLAATLGLPLYVNSEASLPLVRTMLDAGMSQGAALAFLITGAGTSFGAVAGMLTIARWRVVALVIGTLWAGAVLSGVMFNILF